MRSAAVTNTVQAAEPRCSQAGRRAAAAAAVPRLAVQPACRAAGVRTAVSAPSVTHLALQRPAARSTRCQAAAASEAGQSPLPIPRGPQETVQQALAACTKAWEAGVKRQRVDLLLPLIGATDLDDW